MLTSFEAFQALNSKSGGLTAHEIFGKMLLCVKGMSAEKVRGVLSVWKTIAQMSEGYENLADDPHKVSQMLAKELDVVEQRKKIGPALSHKVSELFVQDRYTPE
jgi:crossover junction endonuclease MUS81